jgi:hypothetical protein
MINDIIFHNMIIIIIECEWTSKCYLIGILSLSLQNNIFQIEHVLPYVTATVKML